jgi:hypothetical protein
MFCKKANDFVSCKRTEISVDEQYTDTLCFAASVEIIIVTLELVMELPIFLVFLIIIINLSVIGSAKK